jgi:hypothetical protein
LAAVVAAFALGAWGTRAGDLPVLEVSVAAEVYLIISEQIEIQPGLSTSGYPQVVPRARLTLDSTPRGAQVTLDGLARGPTPLQIEDLLLGAHDLRVEDSAHAVFHRNLRVEAPH